MVPGIDLPALIAALRARTGFALATRIPAGQRPALAAALPDAVLEPVSGMLRIGALPRTGSRPRPRASHRATSR